MKSPDHPPASISVRLVWPYLRLVDKKGMAMQRESIAPWLADPDARIDHSLIIDLMLESIEREGDPARGLKAAMLSEPSDREPFEQAARGADTLGEGYRRLCRWFPVLNSASELTMSQRGDHTEICYRQVRGKPEPPAFADSVLSWLARFTCRYSELDQSRFEFHFTQPRPEYAEEYRRCFSSRVFFSEPTNALVLPSQLLETRLSWQSPSLTRAYELRAEQLLADLGFTPETVAASVRSMAARHLEQGVVTMQWVADRLEMSVPTLRRRLLDERTTFKKVVDELRAELAERKLRDVKVSVTEVAAALGFANVSAFDRAFRRWRGTAPSHYRAPPAADGSSDE